MIIRENPMENGAVCDHAITPSAVNIVPTAKVNQPCLKNGHIKREIEMNISATQIGKIIIQIKHPPKFKNPLMNCVDIRCLADL